MLNALLNRRRGRPSPLVVGLTGGIGSGKTTTAARFAQRGVEVIDADQISRDLTQHDPAVRNAIRELFGPAFFATTGQLDRSRLRALIFADREARQQLESILHPPIWRTLEQRAAVASGLYCLLDVPLLIESDGHKRVDQVVVVDLPEALQRQRVMDRGGINRAEVDAIMAQQSSRAQRRAYADHIIDNSGTLDQLTPQVEQVDRKLRDAAVDAHRYSPGWSPKRRPSAA